MYQKIETVEDALRIAKEAEREGLSGMYPKALIVLAEAIEKDAEAYTEGEVFSTRVLASKCKKMEDAMKEFVHRCDIGEVRSTRTYNQFKEILGI